MTGSKKRSGYEDQRLFPRSMDSSEAKVSCTVTLNVLVCTVGIVSGICDATYLQSLHAESNFFRLVGLRISNVDSV